LNRQNPVSEEIDLADQPAAHCIHYEPVNNMSAERILLVDTEKNILLAYNAVLEEEGYVVEVASTVDEALQKLSVKSLAVLITELYLKGVSTINMIKQAKYDRPELYSIMITASSPNSEQYEEIIRAGVDDIFMKPFSPRDLLITIKKGLKRRSMIVDFLSLGEKLKQLQHTDTAADENYGDRGLVRNSLYINTIVEKEITRSKRYNHPFSLVVLDIHGEKAGRDVTMVDERSSIVHEIASILLHNTRKTDIISSFNGSFVLILVETSLDGTRILARRLQREIARIPLLKDKYGDQPLSEAMKVDCLSYPQHADHIQRRVHEIARWRDASKS